MKPLVVGESVESAGRTIGEGDVNLFAGLVGDFTPVHIDETFARTTPHGTRIAHGPHSMATAIGMATHTGLFGARVIGLVNINWDFSGAVKIGDTIRSRRCAPPPGPAAGSPPTASRSSTSATSRFNAGA
jgi:acyl dehydratase